MDRIYLLDIRNGVDETLCRTAFPERYEKARQNPNRDAGLRSMGVGVLLNRVLGLEEKDICISLRGKPSCRDGHICFSLSHSGNYCALGVSRAEIGIDLEKPDPKHLSVAKSVFLPEETEYMKEDAMGRFFTLWTVKEALSKALGTGLAMGFQKVNVLPILQGKTVTVEGRHFSGRSEKIDGYALSVVTEKPDTGMTVEIL